MASNLDHIPAAMRAELLARGDTAAAAFESDQLELTRRDGLPPHQALSLLAWQKRRIESATIEEVARARTNGLSWRQIGESLGISAQGARQRFALRNV